MDFAHVPWKDGLEAVLGVVLLKILYDCVYVKIPRGFAGVRKTLTEQIERGESRHAEHLEKMLSLENAIKHLEAKKCSGRRRTDAAAATKKKSKPS